MKKLTVTGTSKTDIAKKLNLIRDMLKKGYGNGMDWEYEDMNLEYFLQQEELSKTDFKIIRKKDEKEEEYGK